MPISNRAELYGALGKGALGFDEIRDTPEQEWIDFKQAHYRLDERSRRLALAKDVSGFANAGGGVIVVGVATKRLENENLEVASDLTPVRSDLIDRGRIRDLIGQYVYPQINELNSQIWPIEEDKVVLTIDVPRQDSADRPFLVTEGVSKEGEHHGNMLGYFRRVADTTQPVPPSLAHDLMRDGFRFREWPVRTTGMDEYPESRDEGTPSPLDEAELLVRAQEDARAAQAAHAPYLIVQSWNRPAFRVDNIHGRFRRDFLNPPQIRPNGFNVDFGDYAEVLRGGGLRKTLGDKALSVEPRGLCTLVIGSETLSHGMRSGFETEYAINSVVLVEFVLEFCRFIHSHLRDGDRPTSVQARLRHLNAEGACRLSAGVPRPFYEADARKPAGGANELVTEIVAMDAPGRAAFELLAGIYSQYGLPNEAIPYAESGVISEDEIRSIGS